jgi:nucleoside-diphosphate-sugar epimerase
MITVLGSGGFIGSSLVKKLKEKAITYNAPPRGEELSQNMGHIIYCIGLTADFRRKPFETVEAHVCLLNKILEKAEFESLTYLSSTRVYINSKEKEVFENTPITISIDDPDELYTLTKLTAERLCLSSGHNAKVVRLSNVYGADYSSENFITDIIKKIQAENFIKFFTTPASAKDYISVDTLCDLLIRMAVKAKERIYNVASGENVSNADIIQILKEHYKFGYDFDDNAREIVFPVINIDRIKNEFGFTANNNKRDISELIKKYGNDNN